MTSPYAKHWDLDPEVVFLNHGSFGGCPRAVLDEQDRIRREMEREPVRFLHREIEGRLDAVRHALGPFLGADPDDLAFVTNATTGVNTVLRGLSFAPGDRILVTNQEYNATRNAAVFAARRAGAEVVVVDIPFPVDDPAKIRDAVLAAVDERVKLLVIDHIVSQTGLILPVQEIVAGCTARGVDVLVDGAHAPGQIELDLDALGAAYYTANCHKWLCTPKGSAILHVRKDRQDRIPPLVISHGANSTRTDRSRFRIEHDWCGTTDPSPWLTVPFALRWFEEQVEGGWPAVRAHNHELVLEGRRLCCAALEIEEPCPGSMLGSLASMPLPPRPARDGAGELNPLGLDPLHVRLFDVHRIEVPVMPWPAPPHRLLRISAQLHNHVDQYRQLADALRAERLTMG